MFFAAGAGGSFPKRWLNIFQVTSGAFGEIQNMRNSVAANVNLHGASPWHLSAF